MKTWKMIQSVMKNPEKQYRRVAFGGSMSVGFSRKSNQLVWLDGKETPFTIIRTDEDWEEIPQEVAWQEAIEAWANGKTVKCTARGYDDIYQKYDVVNDCNDSFLVDELGNPMDAYEILEGKWYILEGEE